MDSKSGENSQFEWYRGYRFYKKNKSVNLENVNEDFSFLKWSLNLKKITSQGKNALIFSFEKDEKYSICVILCEKSDITESMLKAFKSEVVANEYLFASSTLYGEKDILYLCTYDIDSFRRIQQILLRGMIYSDRTHTDCAFCSNKTLKTEHGYECGICRARVESRVCEKTSKIYWVSEILKYRAGEGKSRTYTENNSFLHDRCSEAQLHFRNITDITPDAIPICPHCGRAHKF